jgi:hypothetical protein
VNRAPPSPRHLRPAHAPSTSVGSLPRVSASLMLLVSALAVGTILPSWYLNEHVLTRQVYERVLSGSLTKSAADSFSDTVRGFSLSGYFGSIGLLAIRVVGESLLLQLALLGFGQDVPLRRVAKVVGWAALAMVLRGLAHTFVLSVARPLSISARDLMITPWSFADFTAQNLSPFAAFAFYNAVNPFEALWCAIIVVLLTRYGVRLRVAASAVITVWTGLLMLQVAGYAYLAHLHL